MKTKRVFCRPSAVCLESDFSLRLWDKTNPKIDFGEPRHARVWDQPSPITAGHCCQTQRELGPYSLNIMYRYKCTVCRALGDGECAIHADGVRMWAYLPPFIHRLCGHYHNMALGACSTYANGEHVIQCKSFWHTFNLMQELARLDEMRAKTYFCNHKWKLTVEPPDGVAECTCPQ